MKAKVFGHVRIPFKRIHIELTNICNFDCTFCPKSVMTRPYGLMETSLAKAVIDEIQELGLAEKITFHVMGEPTLHPGFFEILDHALIRGVPVGLTTNGGGLGGQVGQLLLERKLHQVDVSLQTPDEASFALRRAGRLKFDEYFENLMSFFGQYRLRHPETIFKFRFLNTTFRSKSMERQTGPIKVISSTLELRAIFSKWVQRIYSTVGPPTPSLPQALNQLNRLVSYKWNVVEVLPGVFFETYILADWGHAFHQGRIHPAWAGFCDGMRDHFAVLWTGEVTLCCIDYDGQTAIGRLPEQSLGEILAGEPLGGIMRGFKRFQPVHPYCRRCLGSKDRLSWLFKPAAVIVGLHLLRPYFYHQVRLVE